MADFLPDHERRTSECSLRYHRGSGKALGRTHFYQGKARRVMSIWLLIRPSNWVGLTTWPSTHLQETDCSVFTGRSQKNLASVGTSVLLIQLRVSLSSELSNS